MRETSSRPKVLKSGETGWLHPINGHAVHIPKREEKRDPVINVGKLLEEWNKQTTYAHLQSLAKSLGVAAFALGALGFQWAKEHNAWAIPMKDGFGNPIGIRLRSETGAKWSVRGSTTGIFLPNMEPQNMVIICEGATDCAAALSMGFFALGRPSCSGGISHIRPALTRLRIQKAVIVADNDTPGVNGAMTLRDYLPMPVASLVLPSKDLREFISLGGTRELLTSMLDSVVWHQPQTTI